MKKRNSRMKVLYWLIPIIVAVLWMAVGAKAQCIQKAVGEKIVFGLLCLDTLGRNATPDSVHVTTYKDNATYSTFFERSTTSPFSDVDIDTTQPALGGADPVSWWYVNTISDIDGATAHNAQMSITVDLWKQGYATTNNFCVQIVSDSLNDVVWRIAAFLDQVVSAGLDSSETSRILGRKVWGIAAGSGSDSSAVANRKIDSTNVARSVWNTTFADAGGKAGSIGDSLNGMQYSKVSQLAVTNLDATVSSRSTLDSATTSRISRRMWGVQLGAAGSTDSLTIAQRLVDATRLSGDATAADNAELFFDGTGYAGTNNVIPTVTTVTNLTNAPTNGDLTATMKTSVSAATWGASTAAYTGAGTFGNRSQRDSIRIKEIIDSLDTQLWASTAASGLDSAVVSRIMRRMWGVQLGASGSSDSLTKAQRLAAIPVDDIVSDSVRKILGDSLATFGDSSVFARSVWDNDVVSLANRTVTPDSTSTSRFVWNTPYANIDDKASSVGDSLWSMRDYLRETHDSLDTQAWASTAASSLDSAVVSRIMRRMWGIQLGAAGSSDSLTIDQRTINATRISGDAVAADNAEAFFDGTGYAGTNNVIPLVTTATNAGGWNSTTTDSVLQAIDYTNNARPVLRGSSAGDFVDVTATGEVGIDLDNTAGTLAKTTDITGFNDIAATAIVSSGAITTSGGAVSTVTTTGTVTNMVTANVTQISGDGTAADNLETMLDGTGGQTLTLEGLTIAASSGPGMSVTGAANSNGVLITGGSSQPGLAVVGGSSAVGATIYGATGQSGALISSGASGGYGLILSGVDGAMSGELTTANFGTGAFTENDFANGALRFGQEIDTVGDESGVKTEATTGGGGATAADIWAYGTRTLTSGSVSGTSTSWIALVDAPGTTANRQFVIDSAAIGGKNEIGLTNIAIMVRDADAGKYTQRGIIERVNCVDTTGLCTLQTSEAFLFDFEAGDSVFMKWDEPNYVIATVAEAAAVNKDTLLGADTTGHGGDGTIAGAIVAEKADTAKTKTMLDNYGLGTGLDSLAKMAETTTGAGMPRRNEIVTARAMAESAAVVIITEDSARYPRGGAIDTARNASGLSGGSCTGDRAIAFNLYFVDSLGTDEAVGDGHISLYTNANCTGQPAYWGKTGALGYIPFSIDTGTYWACASKMASVNATNAQYFHVTASSSDTVLGYGFATSTRAVIQGIVQVSGGPDSVCAYCDVVFEMVSTYGNIRDTVLNTIVLPTPLQGFTNASGMPLHASGQPFELHKTQNLASYDKTGIYPVKWIMKVRLADGTFWQSAQFVISNSTDVVDIGEL